MSFVNTLMSKLKVKTTLTDQVVFTFKVEGQELNFNLPEGWSLRAVDNSSVLGVLAQNFKNTKVQGKKIPGLVNFSQIKLVLPIVKNGEKAYFCLKELTPFYSTWFFNKSVLRRPVEKVQIECRGQSLSGFSEVVYSSQKKSSYLNLRLQSDGDEVKSRSSLRIKTFTPSKEGQFILSQWIGDEPSQFSVISSQCSIQAANLFGKEYEFLNNQKPEKVYFYGESSGEFEWEVLHL